MESICFSCEYKNPSGQAFCGSCGAPLALSSYVARQVDTRIAETTRDRELIEKESAIRIFERVYGWAKIVSGLAAALIAVLAIGATWRFFDLRSAVNNAEANVAEAAKVASSQMQTAASGAKSDSTKVLNEVTAASKKAIQSSTQAELLANKQRIDMVRVANGAREQIRIEAKTFTDDFTSARQQLGTVRELEPQVREVQSQLASAQAQIQEQQKVIVSSEEFAKKVLLSQRLSILDVPSDTAGKHSVIPGSSFPGKTTVWFYMLLPEVPLKQAMRVQFHQTVAAAGSFLIFHNVVIMAVEANAQAELLGHDVSVEYFVDPADKTIISKLESRGGRVFADGEALPKIGEKNDPEFIPNRLFPFYYPTGVPPAVANPVPKS